MAKTFVVTGANQGIGLEFVRQLRERGHDVWGSYRKDAGPLTDFGCHAVGDIEQTDGSCLEKLASSVTAASVDVLILNAAILLKEGADRIGELDKDVMMKIHEVNTVAPLMAVQAFLKAGKLQAGSTVVLVTSLMGSISDNSTGGLMGYRMSKTALNMGGACLAHDLRERGISVCLIHPGFVDTNMVRQHGFNSGISVFETVSLMLPQIEAWDLAKTGTCVSRKGEPYPW